MKNFCHEKNRQLIIKYQHLHAKHVAGDASAHEIREKEKTAQSLINQFEMLINKVARKNYFRGVDDVKQEASIALLEVVVAVDPLNPSFHNFPGLVSIAIKRRINKKLPDHNAVSVPKLSPDFKKVALQVLKLSNSEASRHDMIASCVADFGVSEDYVSDVINTLQPVSSLDEPGVQDAASCEENVAENQVFHDELSARINAEISSMPEEMRVAYRLSTGYLMNGSSEISEMGCRDIARALNRLGLTNKTGGAYHRKTVSRVLIAAQRDLRSRLSGMHSELRAC